MTTRSEHVAWCKQRALDLVAKGEITEAFASLASDFCKHPETNVPAMVMLVSVGSISHSNSAAAARKFIEDFA